ncbi:MAG: hypothetical protein ACNA8R_12570 [Nitriliruptoraceae bacterium]
MTISASPRTDRGPSGPVVGRFLRLRAGLLALGGAGLLLGTYTGLARGGVGHRFAPADLHGVVMVLGFLGTLIALERAVALSRGWGFLGPALSGAAVLVLPVSRTLGGLLLVAAGAVVTAVYVALLRRGHLDVHLGVMTLGAAAWVLAAVLWLAGSGPVRITPLLAAFLVLTIVGERLELSRLTLPSVASRRRFLVAVGVFSVGTVVAAWSWRTGLVIGGLGLLGQVAWLSRHDIARRTIHRPGLPRFAAICLLSAYAWLAVSATLWIAMGLGATGPLLHDALVHSLFLGFVLSMAMGHAPIIVPAVLSRASPFHPVAYAPLVLLHVSVAVRIAADLAGSQAWRTLALHGNVAALTLFVAVSVAAVRRGPGDGYPDAAPTSARPTLPLLQPGDGRTPGSSPFASAAPSILVALLSAAAAGVWVVAGAALPGGRVLAVHLLTLGALTTLILTFSEHFTRTLTRAPGDRHVAWPIVTTVSIVLLLVGLATRALPVLAVGATATLAVVGGALWRLRRLRRRAVGARFLWVVRSYEQAHALFLVAGVLGAVLGLGLVTGPWFAAVRLAHLHANILGWGGLTLLATLVFFGPTMVRTRIEPGADADAARLLPAGALALGIAVLLLAASGLSGPWGVLSRVAAGGALAVVATTATAVLLPVLRAALRAAPSGPRPAVLGTCGWFIAVLWADVALVTAGAWSLLDALGLAALLGVLGQAVLATLTYLAPMLRGRRSTAREVLRARLDTGATTRTFVANLGVLLAVVGATRAVPDLPLLGVGLVLVAAPALSGLVSALRPIAR